MEQFLLIYSAAGKLLIVIFRPERVLEYHIRKIVDADARSGFRKTGCLFFSYRRLFSVFGVPVVAAAVSVSVRTAGGLFPAALMHGSSAVRAIYFFFVVAERFSAFSADILFFREMREIEPVPLRSAGMFVLVRTAVREAVAYFVHSGAAFGTEHLFIVLAERFSAYLADILGIAAVSETYLDLILVIMGVSGLTVFVLRFIRAFSGIGVTFFVHSRAAVGTIYYLIVVGEAFSADRAIFVFNIHQTFLSAFRHLAGILYRDIITHLLEKCNLFLPPPLRERKKAPFLSRIEAFAF